MKSSQSPGDSLPGRMYSEGREGRALSSLEVPRRPAPPPEWAGRPGPRDSLSPPDRSEDLTISWRRQILQSEAESQRIAVRKLLNRLQHPGWYVSRLQTIRCGYTACGGYGHSGGRRRLSPTTTSSPVHGLRKDGSGHVR